MTKIIKMNPQQWAAYMGHLGERFMPAMMRGVLAGANRCVPLMQQRTMTARPASDNGRSGAVDTGLYKAAWRGEAIPTGAAIRNRTPQAPIIESGRRPSPVNRAGIQNLMKWAERRLGLNQEEARNAAFAIARTLAKRPLRARHVMSGALKEMTKLVMEEITHELDVEINKK